MSGKRRWIFDFQFRYSTVGILLDDINILPVLYDTVLRRRHINTCIFGKSKPLRVHRNSNFLEISRCQIFFCLSGCWVYSEPSCLNFSPFRWKEVVFFSSTQQGPFLGPDLWKELDSLTILQLVGLRLWLLGVFFSFWPKEAFDFWRLKNAKFQCHDSLISDFGEVLNTCFVKSIRNWACWVSKQNLSLLWIQHSEFTM